MLLNTLESCWDSWELGPGDAVCAPLPQFPVWARAGPGLSAAGLRGCGAAGLALAPGPGPHDWARRGPHRHRFSSKPGLHCSLNTPFYPEGPDSTEKLEGSPKRESRVAWESGWSSRPGVRKLLDFFPALFFALAGGSGKEVKSGQNLEGQVDGGRGQEGDPWSP